MGQGSAVYGLSGSWLRALWVIENKANYNQMGQTTTETLKICLDGGYNNFMGHDTTGGLWGLRVGCHGSGAESVVGAKGLEGVC